jgi:hypothetical membrane protein
MQIYPDRNTRPTSVLPIALIAATAAFTFTWLVLGFVNDGYRFYDIVIEDYSPISQPISGLGLGKTAARMNTAFVIYGSIAIAGAFGISRNLAHIEPRTRQAALWTLGLHGLGAVLVGVFTLEEMPMHSFGFLLVLAPIIGFAIVGRRLRSNDRWRRLSLLLIRVATPVGLLLVVAFFATFNPEAAGSGEGFAGLSQRALIVFVQAWIVAIAWTTREGGDLAENGRSNDSPASEFPSRGSLCAYRPRSSGTARTGRLPN